jgi:hypothetical protein
MTYIKTKAGIITGEIVKTDKDVYGLCLTCEHSFRHEHKSSSGGTHKTALCLGIPEFAPGFMPPIPTKKCSHHEEKKKEDEK